MWAALAAAVVVAVPGPVSGTVAAPTSVAHHAQPARDLRPWRLLVAGPCSAPPVERSVPGAPFELRQDLHRLSRRLDPSMPIAPPGRLLSPHLERVSPGTIPLPVSVGPLCADARPFREGSPGIQLVQQSPE
jgi:hypothetical protein